MEQTKTVLLEKARIYIKNLPDVYTDTDLGQFEYTIKDNTESDPEQVTLEVTPYWSSLDELEGGYDTFDYGNKGDVSIDDIPLLKSELEVKVISRNYDTYDSRVLEVYTYDPKKDKLVKTL